MLVVFDELLVGELLADQTLAVHLEDALHGEVRVDGISTIANEHTHVVDLTCLSSFDDKSSRIATCCGQDGGGPDQWPEEQRQERGQRRCCRSDRTMILSPALNGLGGSITDAVQCFIVALEHPRSLGKVMSMVLTVQSWWISGMFLRALNSSIDEDWGREEQPVAL